VVHSGGGETVTDLPAQTVAELSRVLKTLAGNADARRPGHTRVAGMC
jgi:hypothetical protein